MKILRRSLHVELEVGEPAQRRQHAGQTGREHRRVGDHDRIASQEVLLRFDEGSEVRAADFLLAFGEHDHVDG